MSKNEILKKIKNAGKVIKNNIVINDTYDTITSRLNGNNYNALTGSHIRCYGITNDEYNILFPDAPLVSQNFIDNISSNYGKHMKTDKYKKIFSDKILGDKNPNHSSNTTEQERKERSPFSIEFYIKNEPDKSLDELKEIKQVFKLDVSSHTLNTTQLEYYLNKGFTLEEAIELRSERQRTFTLAKCIEKYREDEGIRIFNDRQDRWQDSLNNNGNLKRGYSQISQILFDSFRPYYNINNFSRNVFYATKNSEFYLNKIDGGLWLYDFADIKNKKLIEFNGDVYHANPKMYEAEQYPHPFRTDVSAGELWEFDEQKKQVAIKKGYELLVVWESEYHKQPEQILNKCLDFLNLKH